MLIGKYSSSAHEPMLHLLVRSLGLLVVRETCHERFDRAAVQPALDAQGAGKRSTTQRKAKTLGPGMQVRPTAGCSCRLVRHELEALTGVHSDDAQQLSLGGPLPTSHARPDRKRVHGDTGLSGHRDHSTGSQQ
jgi:hypothetical protein